MHNEEVIRTKPDEVSDLLRYATNQEVSWYLQSPQSEYVFKFHNWNLQSCVSASDVYTKASAAVANDILTSLYTKDPPPSFIEPKEVCVNISPDLSKLNESIQPMTKALSDMADKLGEAYKEIHQAFQPFKKKLEELADSLQEINNKAMPASCTLSNKDINQKVTYPCDCGGKRLEANMRSVIMHLNDMHKWTRESIADWLDTLPNQPIYYPDIRTDEEKIPIPQNFGPYKLGNIAAGSDIIIYNGDGSLNQTFKGNGEKIDVTFHGYAPGYVEVVNPNGVFQQFNFDDDGPQF